MDFFSDGQAVVGSRIDEIFTRWSSRPLSEGEKRSLIDNSFYKKGGRRCSTSRASEHGGRRGGPLFLYIFDKVDALPFLLPRPRPLILPELVDQFFGRSPAMGRRAS